ncbi:MAG: hypothetical protein ACTHNI_13520, partial [Cellulosimicrobium cellulans]
MILGDLLDARVVGPDGEDLGFLVDVRLALDTLPDDAPSDGDPDDAHPEDRALSASVRRRDRVGRARVVGVLVSPRTGASFLGYERTEVDSPAIIAAFLRWRARGSFLVLWPDLAAIGADGVHLRPGATHY